MTAPPVPSLFRTPIPEIDEVIRDLQIEQRKEGEAARYRIYYCVDASEIVTFCFPLNPFNPGEPNLSTIAADQAALHELFYKRPRLPVLIPDYAEELARHFNFVRSSTEGENQREEREMVGRLIEGAPLDPLGTGGAPDANYLLEQIEQNFDVKLAVWMGITSIGAKRFYEVLTQRLHKITDIGEPFVEGFVRGFQPKLSDDIFQVQKHFLERQTEIKKLPQRLLAAKTDARAIDWLLQLNQAAQAGAANGPRPLFLYLSSAPKTARIFNIPSVRHALPVVEGKHYPIWRKRSQLTLLITAMRNAQSDDADTIIDNLRKIRRIAVEVLRMEKGIPSQYGAACESCLLGGGVGNPDCTWRHTCEEVRQLEHAISDRTEPIANLGLVARIQTYANLLKAKPRPQDQKEYLAYLQRLLNMPEVPDLALRRIEDLQSFARAQSVLARGKLELLPVRTEPREPETTLLPDAKPYLVEDFPAVAAPYDDITRAMFAFHTAPEGDIRTRHELLDTAMRSFLELDERVSFPGGPDHEVTRCLIYLSFGGREGEEDALAHAKKMIEEYPQRREAFLLLWASAALELGKYQDVHNACSRAIELQTRHWMFYHMRSVNTFEWCLDERLRRFCPVPIERSIADVEEAIRRISAAGGARMRLGLLHNNLAYFSSHSETGPARTIFDLKRARASLDRLLELVPREKWAPESPHFFHTEAHILFLEHQHAAQGTSTRGLLLRALESVDAALQLRDKPLYSALKRQIEGELKKARAVAETQA